MCLVSSPKATATPPPPEFLHNSLIDSGTMSYATGRNQLKVDLNSTGQSGLNMPQNSSPPPMSGAGMTPKTGIQSLNIGSAGMVIPTIGGVLAGAVPGAAVRGTPGK